MKKILSENMRRPDYYRTAYLDLETGKRICYPMGIHLIFRFFRRIKECSTKYTMSTLEKIILARSWAYQIDVSELKKIHQETGEHLGKVSLWIFYAGLTLGTTCSAVIYFLIFHFTK